MSDKIAHLDSKAAHLVNMLKSAPPKQTSQTSPPNLSPLITMTITSLLLSTLPWLFFYRIFAPLSGALLIWCLIKIALHRQSLSTSIKFKTIAAIAAVTIITGCSGLSSLLDHDPVPLVVAQHPEIEFKVGTVQKVALFGFGLDGVTEEAAMADGGINKAFASQSTTTYGWISVARVRVYGE